MSKKPNIVFYFTDQQRADTVTDDIMPELCALAERNANFVSAFTCQPVCGPARACLQTGMFAGNNGTRVNGIPLNSDIKPLASYLADIGYDTAYIGKWHLASGNLHGKKIDCRRSAVPSERLGGYRYFRGADLPEFTSHGYDGYMFDENGNKIEWTGYRVDAVNDFAIEYLKNRPTDKPFFLFVSQLEPHHQNDRRRCEGYKPTVERFKNHEIPADLTALKGNYEKEYPDYLSAINRIDHNFRLLIDELSRQGILDDTIVFYTADHGNHFKTRNFEYKRSPHDASLRIPLVAIGGGFKTVGKVEALTSLLDLPPTILELAGAEIPADYQGKSLMRTLGGEKQDFVFAEISESFFGYAVRTERYTYSIKAVFANPWAKSAHVFTDYCLYDDKADPRQIHDLKRRADYKQIKKQLRAILVAKMTEIGRKKPLII